VKIKIQHAFRRALGVTLIELMVALSIGSFLMIGAVTVFMQSRTAFRVTESVARLQENARFVLGVLEPDIRMASYFGLTSRPYKILGRATSLDPTPAGLGVGSDCGANWAISIAQAVSGTNNGYGWTCAAFGGGTPDTADTFVLRRVSEDPIAPPLDGGTLYVQSARFQDSQLFAGPLVPGGYLPTTSQTHRFIANGYYVSTNSSLDTPGNNVPSLRVKTLVGGAFGPRIVDREVLPGVEDFQVQFGVDTDVVGTATRGSVNRYVNSDDPILDPVGAAFNPDATVLAVRIWVRVRAQRPENGFTDTASYIYADQNVPAPNDQFRRAVVSKTIYLRNARTPV
jgi:type IV pilus assembly protein PilW